MLPRPALDLACWPAAAVPGGPAGRREASIRVIQTSSSPTTQRAQTRISTSTLCPAQAATSVAGTPELSRHVTPECLRS